MSCNGCRVLRKGCSDDCVIRPCLQWITSPDSQANATMFLAKFYGRAGLINLISAGSEHLRPAIFRSLLYEACGRIVNPIYGSVGLLWSGNWSQCQSAVDSVLKGSAQFMQHPTIVNSAQTFPALKTYDIRHVPKPSAAVTAADTAYDLHKVRAGPQFKRTDQSKRTSCRWLYDAASCRSMSTGGRLVSKRDSPEATESGFSAETIEASVMSRPGEELHIMRLEGLKNGEDQDQLDLSLRVGPHAAAPKAELADHQ
ncbi:hypothetical protein SAY87_017002 [Trapa incisa]|uniref:LOB domain-containing protein n=1 Tax=Trapa incisa TaxID=236973 RepID=A0AAN7L7S6_9MYRT|nr:hypothetical protein SAY87_017002 [Trapa incisa]